MKDLMKLCLNAAPDVLSIPPEDAQRVLKRGVEMLTHGLDSGVSVTCGQSHGDGPVLHNSQFAQAGSAIER
jgi:hypothetical protein